MKDNRKLIATISASQQAYDSESFCEAAEYIFRACKEMTGADSGYIVLFNEEKDSNEEVFLDSGKRPCTLPEDLPMPIRGMKEECLSVGRSIYDNEFGKSDWKKFLPPGHLSLDNVLFAPIVHHEQVIGLLGLANKSGGFSKLDTEIAQIFAKKAAVVYFNLQDRKSLLESEKKYKDLFDNLPVGIYITDNMDRIVEMNNKMLQLLNIKEINDLKSRDISLYYSDPCNRIEWQKQLEKTGEVRFFESMIKNSAGKNFWVTENANLIEDDDGQKHCEVSILDITKRKNAEEALRKTYLELDAANAELNKKAGWLEDLNKLMISLNGLSKEDEIFEFILNKLNTIWDTGFVGIGRISQGENTLKVNTLSDGKIIEESVCILFEEDFSLLLNKSHGSEVFTKKDISKRKPTELAQYIDSLLTKPRDRLIITSINSEETIYGNFILVLNNEDVTNNSLNYIESIAEFTSTHLIKTILYSRLQKSYEELKTAQDTIKRQERIKAMGQIASGITHDINNTLAPITLYSEALIETEEGLSERAVKYITTIQNAVADIENVTQRLRTFYRQDEEVSFEEIKVSDLFEEIIELSLPKWKSIPNKNGVNIEIEKYLDDVTATVFGVKSDIREAMVNCIFNSVDAMPHGGKIRLVQSSNSEGIKLRVEDSGIGMNAEQLERCMEPFYTTKGSAGTGLGLSGVFGMIQRHNGTVTIESIEGNGTVINMQFMADHLPRGIANKSTANHDSSSLPLEMKILCVDDDKRILDGLFEMLSIDRHRVETAEGGTEALKKLKTMESEGLLPDVILTDLGMPGMDGYKLAEKIASSYPELPIVLLSGWGHQISGADCEANHVRSVLSKPPRINKLRSILKEIQAEKAVKNE